MLSLGLGLGLKANIFGLGLAARGLGLAVPGLGFVPYDLVNMFASSPCKKSLGHEST